MAKDFYAIGTRKSSKPSDADLMAAVLKIRQNGGSFEDLSSELHGNQSIESMRETRAWVKGLLKTYPKYAQAFKLPVAQDTQTQLDKRGRQAAVVPQATLDALAAAMNMQIVDETK